MVQPRVPMEVHGPGLLGRHDPNRIPTCRHRVAGEPYVLPESDRGGKVRPRGPHLPPMHHATECGAAPEPRPSIVHLDRGSVDDLRDRAPFAGPDLAPDEAT